MEPIEELNHLCQQDDGKGSDWKVKEAAYYTALESLMMATPCPTCGVDSGPCRRTRTQRAMILLWSLDHNLEVHRRRITALRNAGAQIAQYP
jgi:hypothetical protein